MPPLNEWKVFPSPVKPRRLQGNVNLLVVLVDFSDKPATVTSLNVFDNLVFAVPVPGRGSVRDYYDEVSHSNVTLVTLNLPSSTGWRRAPQSYAYYAGGNYGMGNYPNNAGRMVEDILAGLDPLVDFSNYDNDGDYSVDSLLVIHTGTGGEFSLNANDVWSHAASISLMGGQAQLLDGVWVDRYVTTPEYWNPALATPSGTDMTIGVACHELAHGLWGLPDLYDTDATASYGIGQWGLMSYGDWNGPAKWNPYQGYWVTDGSSPAWPEAWSRVTAGFDQAALTLAAGQVTLAPAETNANAVLRFKTTALWGQEYFLVENRQRFTGGYDEYLPAGGLLIWHVDEAHWSIYGGGPWADNNAECTSLPHCSGACNWSHYLVAMEQADGLDHLENKGNVGDGGDPFPGTSGRTFFQPFMQTPVNPDSGSWYDVGCGTYSCLDLNGIACVPLGNCQAAVTMAACSPAEADLGDAPASQNNYGAIMTAYAQPFVQAAFPTVYLPSGTPGPIHHFATVDSWLGRRATGESNADWLPDMDGVSNIDPLNDIADQDSVSHWPGHDDGLALPVPLAHCQIVGGLPFTLTIATPIILGPIFRHVNVWVDWNRDGDWADVLNCPGYPPAPERATIMGFALPPGTHHPITAPFTSYITVVEDAPYESWLRISVADQQAPLPGDGRGPVAGYDLGETEDYYLYLYPTLSKSANLPDDPRPGETVDYRLAFGGTGNVIATDSVLSDVLPLGIEYVGSNPPGTYFPSTRTVTWPAPVVPGTSAGITLSVQVTAAPGSIITNTAYLLWGGNRWAHASFGFEVGCRPEDPRAAFGWSEPVCVGTSTFFTNESTGTLPISFTWDLDGDGQVDSTVEDPAWSYGAPGAYTVTLTATNSCATASESNIVVAWQPLQGVSIAGPTSLVVGEEGTYEAGPFPPDASPPLLYDWSNGTAGLTTTYSWATPGEYTIVLTASNACPLVTGTLDVLVSSECISLSSAAIAGPVSLLVGEEGAYEATASPPDASSPQYSWSNGMAGQTTTYSWATPGEYIVAVTASNACSLVTGTLDVLVSSECISLTGITIDGPGRLTVGEEGLYVATPEPLTATNPTYLWSSGDIGPVATLGWGTPGDYTVTVTATNCSGIIVGDNMNVQVTMSFSFRVYLPLVLRR